MISVPQVSGSERVVENEYTTEAQRAQRKTFGLAFGQKDEQFSVISVPRTSDSERISRINRKILNLESGVRRRRFERRPSGFGPLILDKAGKDLYGFKTYNRKGA